MKWENFRPRLVCRGSANHHARCISTSMLLFVACIRNTEREDSRHAIDEPRVLLRNAGITSSEAHVATLMASMRKGVDGMRQCCSASAPRRVSQDEQVA